MAIIRFSPFRGFGNLERETNDFFRGFGLVPGQRQENWLSGWEPAADVLEKQDRYEIKMELPGVDKEDVKVDLTDSVLTISGEKKYEKENEEESRYVRERAYGSFTRSFTLPGTVNREKVEAVYKNGVLLLTLPKSEVAKPKQITIQ